MSSAWVALAAGSSDHVGQPGGRGVGSTYFVAA